MVNSAKHVQSETSPRLHFIPEWARFRKVRQVQIVRAVGVDKGTVSKWFDGALPGQENLYRLATFLRCEPIDLFRDPNDDWLKRFLEGRKQDEIARIRATLEAAFPK